MPSNENFTRKLNLLYKGNRDYLHGTDLFAALIRETGAVGPVSLRLYKPMMHPLCFSVLSGNEPSRGNIATFVWHEADIQHTGIIAEMPDEKVTSRYDYNEAEVTAMAKFDGHEASLGAEKKYSFIEKLVALHKALLNSIRGEMIDWWFARLDLSRVPRAESPLRLSLTSKPGGRLVKSLIYVGDEEVGSIYFSENAK